MLSAADPNHGWLVARWHGHAADDHVEPDALLDVIGPTAAKPIREPFERLDRTFRARNSSHILGQELSAAGVGLSSPLQFVAGHVPFLWAKYRGRIPEIPGSWQIGDHYDRGD